MSHDPKHSPVAEQCEDVDPDEIRAIEETFGTIVVKEEIDARRMLRPQPSLDPNDPLVSRNARMTRLSLTFVLAELALVAKVLDIRHYLFLHVPFNGERKQL
jgi:hypothetical protein